MVEFTGTDLRNSNLRAVNLTGVALRDADVSGANAVRANMSKVYLWGARLCMTMLASASLSGASFDGADVSRTWFCSKALPDVLDPQVDDGSLTLSPRLSPIASSVPVQRRAIRPSWIGWFSMRPGHHWYGIPLKGMGIECVPK